MNLKAFRFGWACVAVMGFLGGGCIAASAPTEVTIHDDKPFPESLSSTSDGALIIGSMSKGVVYRSAPGSATAEVWIPAGTTGLQVLGVLADERHGTLWVCSLKLRQGTLKTFDLKTGAPRESFAFPGDRSFCNDIAIGADGAAYATDTIGGRILKLAPGAKAVEIWAANPLLAGADGIAFGDDHTIYVNTFTTGHLLRIPVNKGGAAGDVTQLQTSQPLSQPDGMRPVGPNQFLLIEGAGRLDRVTIDGDMAEIDVLKDGFSGPTAVTQVGKAAWVVEGKLKYMNDPKLKDEDPGLFKAYAVPIPGAR